jgi:integrase/recombinase XerD
MKAKKLQDKVSLGAKSPYRKLPLIGPIIDEAITWLRQQGYTEGTIRNHLKATSCSFSWLQISRGPKLDRLSQQDLHSAYHHFHGRRHDVAGTVRIIGKFLQERQLLSEGKPVPHSPLERQIDEFDTYLNRVRGLADSTIRGHRRRLRAFLEFLEIDKDPTVIGTLRLDQIEGFLCQSAKTNNRYSLQHIVATLRAFVSRLHAQGIISKPLYQQIDSPRTYRLEQLPRALPWKQVVSLLRSIDRSNPDSLRDFTMLYLAACYGLRSGEVVRLRLDDIEWQKGSLHVSQTKTKQSLHLPLTDEAGDVLVRYLKTARPHCENRELFLRRRAPMGPLKATAVHDILDGAIRRSGLKLPWNGTHVLRHSQAVHLLRQGMTIGIIGGTLGHRTFESTSIYLRLAVDDLREVGLPVPAGEEAADLEKGSKKKLPPIRLPRLTKPISGEGFVSSLAISLDTYLANRRALGRCYHGEEIMLRRWDDFLFHHYGKAPAITSEMFHSWAQTMPHLTPTVRRNRLRTVRNFLLFHAREHPKTYIPDILTFPRPSPHKLPRLVSENEMARVLATADQLSPSNHNPMRGATVRLALVLLFCCGLRRGELLRLKLEHFDSTENLLRIEATKFHKSRLVPLSDSVLDELRNFLNLRRRYRLAVQPESFLIWSNNPLAHELGYSPHPLREDWRSLCLATKVLDEQGRPPRIHDLRHSFAINALHRWYRSGVNVQTKLPHLATYLGHVSPASTLHYIHLTPGLRQEASKRFHQYSERIFTEGDA